MNSNWTITKVTTTIQSNSSLSGGKGVIFHIYDIQSNNYSEYFIKEVRRGSLYCKCTNSKCETYLNVFPGPLINIIPNGISRRRKLYKIDDTIPHSVLLDKTNYNCVDHYLDKEHTTRCRDINLRLCSATTHAAPREIRGRISSCEYTVDQSLKREWAKVATGLTEKDTNKHSFINWDFNSQILDTGNVDVTNNTAEALNSKFNSITGSRYQTYHSLLSMISDYKKDFFENVTLSQIRDNKLRTRPKSLIRKYEVITEYLYEYEDMTTPEKLEYLFPLLTALHSIPKDPSVPYQSLQSFLPN